MPSRAASSSSSPREATFHVKHDDTDEPPVALPAAPSGAAAVFGERMPLAVRFAEILADTGVSARPRRASRGPPTVGPARAQLRGHRRCLPRRGRGSSTWGRGPACPASPWPSCDRTSTCTSSSRCCVARSGSRAWSTDLGLDNVTRAPRSRGGARRHGGGTLGHRPGRGPSRQAGALVRPAARAGRHARRDEGSLGARPSSRRTGGRWCGSASSPRWSRSTVRTCSRSRCSPSTCASRRRCPQPSGPGRRRRRAADSIGVRRWSHGVSRRWVVGVQGRRWAAGDHPAPLGRTSTRQRSGHVSRETSAWVSVTWSPSGRCAGRAIGGSIRARSLALTIAPARPSQRRSPILLRVPCGHVDQDRDQAVCAYPWWLDAW